MKILRRQIVERPRRPPDQRSPAGAVPRAAWRARTISRPKGSSVDFSLLKGRARATAAIAAVRSLRLQATKGV
jgi:hypothetical protein